MNHIDIRYNNILEIITFEFGLFYAICARYFEIQGMCGRIWILLIGLCFIKNIYKLPGKIRRCLPLIAVCMGLVLLIAANVLLVGQNQFFRSNFLMVLYVMTIPLGLCFLALVMERDLIRLMEANFILLNAFWIINLAVLFLQIKGTGFLIRREWLAANSFYPDQCCGLFGNSGTHELGFFSAFILEYNWIYAIKHKKQEFLLKSYTVFTILLMLLFSLKNDNKSLIACLLVVMAFAYCTAQKIGHGKIRKRVSIILAGIALVGAMTMLLLLIPAINHKIMDYTVKILNFFTIDYALINGSNERFAIFRYALERGNGFFLGRGLGAHSLNENIVGVFKHFGINSMGQFTYLGGLWYFLLHCLLYMVCYFCILPDIRNGWYLKGMATGMILAFSLYSNIFTSSISTLWIMLTALSLCTLQREKKQKRGND